MGINFGKTPRESFRDVLYGNKTTDIPYIVWDNKLPSVKIQEQLIQKGTCIVVKSGVYKTKLKTIESEKKIITDDMGKTLEHTIYHTPRGDISEMAVLRDDGKWREKKLFETPDDYEAILSLIEDYAYTPCYDDFLKDDMKFKQSGIARPATEKSPFFEIIYEIMGIMGFAVEWAENRERVLDIYRALCKKRKERLDIVAASPAEFVIVDGNIETSVIGTDFFMEYYAPLIREACEVLKGKITGLHLDGNNRPLLKPVNELPVDIIESFTPPPDCEISLTEAMEYWSKKRFIVNFPSSVHLQGNEKVKKAALELCSQAGDSGRVMIGICENIPLTDHMTLLADVIKGGG
jgi:hypothetical protein